MPTKRRKMHARRIDISPRQDDELSRAVRTVPTNPDDAPHTDREP